MFIHFSDCTTYLLIGLACASQGHVVHTSGEQGIWLKQINKCRDIFQRTQTMFCISGMNKILTNVETYPLCVFVGMNKPRYVHVDAVDNWTDWMA